MLTLKQERFVQELVKGKSQREAYKNSYNAEKMKDNTIDRKASLLFRRDDIRTRYEELMKEAQKSAVMDAVQARAFIIEQLTQIATGVSQDSSTDYDGDGRQLRSRKGSKQTDRVQALKLLAEIYGVNAVEEKQEEIRVIIENADEYSN